ncbi:MAG: glycosyltransferase, partial [Actinobacteria bacterium]|nr:glycosyltransferase [Actinomycetota bacterium]
MTVDRWAPDRRWGEPGWWTVIALQPRARAHPEAVARLGLRTKHDAPAHALALAGTTGVLDADGVRHRITQHGGLGGEVPAQPTALAALALLWCGRSTTTEELEAGAGLYRWLVERDGVASIRRAHQSTLAQALLLTEQRTLLTDLLPELDALTPRLSHYLRTDLAHPYARPGAPNDPSHTPAGIDPDTEEHIEWERLLSAEFHRSGLAPVQVRVSAQRQARHLFDHLTSPAGSNAPSEGMPLVTVVVPAYRPDEGLLTSLASLTAQTYPDLEIVVVDDASGPDYAGLFDAAVRS